MTVPKVSVTIPVYNTSIYLRQCLDSLCSQTLREIEFIIVNDGSTDSSGKICDEYSKMDSRIKVIHQNNSGLASARETGLKNATGEYIIVCDSDDWVEIDMYERLYNYANSKDADIVVCGYYTEYQDDRQSSSFTIFKEKNEIVDNIDLLFRGSGASWAKLVRRSLFIKNDIHYEPGINLSEDSLIVYKLMLTNPKVVQIPQPLYHYRRIYGGPSYTNSLNMQHIYQLNYTYNWLKDNSDKLQCEELVLNRAIDLLFACLRVTDLNKKFYNEFLTKELSTHNLWKSMINSKTMVILLSRLSITSAKLVVKLLYRFVYR